MIDERLTEEDVEYIQKRGCLDHFYTFILAVLVSVLIACFIFSGMPR